MKRNVFNKLSAFLIMLMCTVSATVQAEIVHHTVCEPTLSSRGFTHDCWENLDNGKFYKDIACTQELTGVDLAKTVVYEKLPESPITRNDGFNVVESDNVQTWGVKMNWAAETTFENTRNILHPTRYVEFKVGDDFGGSARLVWMKNQGDYRQGKFAVNIYVNGTLKQTCNQNNNEYLEGVVVVHLQEAKKGDVVKFEVQQNAYASYAEAAPTFKACLEYTCIVKIMTVARKNGDVYEFSANSISNITFCENNSVPCMAIEKKNGGTTYIPQSDINNVSWNNVAGSADPTSLRFAFRKPDASESLSDLSAEGTVGMLNGREAIVVNLGGSIGKVAVATSNVGANSPSNEGTRLNYNDANNPSVTGLSNGWYVPSKEELEALMDILTWDQYYEGKKLIQRVVKNYGATSLILPSAGFLRDNGAGSISWTAQGCYIWSSTPHYRMLIIYEEKSMGEDYATSQMYVRPFCALPRSKNQVLPVETEHSLNSSSLQFSNDGLGVVFTVNGKTVTYPLEILDKITFFNGKPSVALHADEYQDKNGKYYTTFFSGLEAYNIPEGVKAYTAEDVNGDYVKLTEVEGNIIPRGEAVLIYSHTTADMEMSIADNMGVKAQSNKFHGVDIEKEQGGTTNYTLFHDGGKLDLYKMSSWMMIAPNKAFVTLPSGNQPASLQLLFPGDVPTEISTLPTSRNDEGLIYNLSGQRLNKLQRGINIINGKKVLAK